MDAYAGVGPSCHSITLPMDSCVFIFEMVIDVYVDKKNHCCKHFQALHL